ncbi:MAG TPA: arylsulfatase [Candidatus Sumerlaeota bacterium]|mgnify:FL=1|nr:arylsulfatase [Candidatus Sumerlaeota bacterium]
MDRLTRRGFLGKATTLGAAAILSPTLLHCARGGMPLPQGQRPNILLVITDDQGFGDFGCYGNEVLNTPHLDRLHAESTRLERFYACPLCTPTRASLMTGRYNYRTGAWDTWKGRASLSSDEVTIAEILAANGYRTGIFGKWHLGYSAPTRPQDQGFQETYTWDGVSKGRVDPPIEHNGVLEERQGFITDLIFDQCMSWMEENEDGPFFAYLATFLPHDIVGVSVPEEYVAPFRDVEGLTPGDQVIYGMIAKIDENMGRLLQFLEQSGRFRDTIVIFMSDNGPTRLTEDLTSEPERIASQKTEIGARFNRGLRGGKATLYEGGIRIPFWIRLPGESAAGREIDAPTAHIDVLPTLLDLCSVKPAADNPPIDGRSFAPLLQGTGDWPDRCLFIQNHRVEAPEPGVEYCVVGRQYKLIENDFGLQLYDLHADPGETTNIAGEHPEVVEQMRDAYRKWYADVTSGRGFYPALTALGDPTQPLIDFPWYTRHSVGWPVRIQRQGPYTVSVKGIHHAIFKGETAFELKLGDITLNRVVDPGADTLVFEGLTPTLGESTFDLKAAGPIEEKEIFYGANDPGFDHVTIEYVGPPR